MVGEPQGGPTTQGFLLPPDRTDVKGHFRRQVIQDVGHRLDGGSGVGTASRYSSATNLTCPR